MGKECDGLYYLELIERKKVTMTALRKYNIWHRILGHTSEGLHRKIQQLGDVGTCSEFCDSCISAK